MEAVEALVDKFSECASIKGKLLILKCDSNSN